MSVTFKIFDPSEIVIQSAALGRKIKKAKKAAKAAKAASKQARKARDRQKLVADVTNETYEVAGRLRISMFPNGKHVHIPTGPDGRPRRTGGIVWPLTNDESYVLLLTDKHLLYIAKVGKDPSDLTMLTYRQFVKLDSSVLSEINNNLKELGLRKEASMPTAKPSSDGGVTVGSGSIGDDSSDQLPNPDVSSADPLVYRQPDQHNPPQATWLEGSAPDTR